MGTTHAPLLSPGDRLSVDEFIDRWYQLPELKFAELIDGVVYMPPPMVPQARAHANNTICLLLALYAARTPGTAGFSNGTWLMTESNVPQPDCGLRIRPECGGRSSVRREFAAGAPELITEICDDRSAYDLGPKLALYIVDERRFEWRALQQGSYQILEPDSGIYRSLIFPGLWIDEAGFWKGDSDTLLHTLDQGPASQEHSEFAARLAQQKRPV